MRKLVTMLLATWLILSATGAWAATMGFDLVISGDVNVPTFTLTNTGSLKIDYFKMTIGKTTYNFDSITGVIPGAISYTVIVPDTVDDSVRTDTQEISFTNFTSGSIFQWNGDIDPDNYNHAVNYKSVLFNNGSYDNSVVTVTFSTGEQLQGTWPDAATLDTYTMSLSDVSTVPVPAAVWLLGSGLLGLLGLRRKLS